MRATQRTMLAFGLAACGSMMIPGCNNSPKGAPIAGQADPYASPGNNPRITLSSPDLAGSLGFNEPTTNWENGVLTVSVPTRSLGDTRYLLDYRFIWYDDQGFELKQQPGWREIALEPREQRRIRGNAIDSRARDWRLHLRWANR